MLKAKWPSAARNRPSRIILGGLWKKESIQDDLESIQQVWKVFSAE
ncbi:hypothetical protein [Bacillus sp. UMB0893]|nr:hypothetical protein [Bacillus sp. UMB0893]